jgi:hypothetical protein
LQKLRRYARALALGKQERLIEYVFRGRGHDGSVPPRVSLGKTAGWMPRRARGGKGFRRTVSTQLL